MPRYGPMGERLRTEPGTCQWQLPDPALAEPLEDLVAVGGDLEPATLLAAYRRGLFPMRVDGRTGDLGWWSPDPRGVLPLDGLRVSKSLRRSLRRFTVTIDRAFDDVILACSDEGREHGWITPEFRRAYSLLNRLGWAHSVEVWNPAGDLVGGLYGVEVGGLFAGESMFHLEPDASKVALVHLVEALGGPPAAARGRILDVQWATDHLVSLGAIEIPRRYYLELIPRATALLPALP